MDDVYVGMLTERKIKPTAVRILILKQMLKSEGAFSMLNLEESIGTVDKSTLSRTINLFHDKRLIHGIDDGSGSLKYEVCRSGCYCGLEDLHVHFYCVKCRRTYCLKGVPIPEVSLPEGFILEDKNFVLRGICRKCSKFAT